MIYRRFWQKLPSGSGRRWLSCSYTARPPPPGPAARRQSTRFLGLWPRVCDFGQARTRLYSSNKHTDNFPYDIKKSAFSTLSLVDHQVGEIVDVPLAQTGEGIAECEVLKWFVQEGDEVEEFQPLCEVQSDKATLEITSRYKGKVSRILHVPGGIVKVGETLLKMIVEESAVPSQIGDNLGKPVRSDIFELNCKKSGGILSTPAVRDLAKQYGINLNDVHGTGKNGRVLREDVLQYAADQGIIKEVMGSSLATTMGQLPGGEDEQPHVPAAYEWNFEDETILLRGYHRAMVKSMSLAATIPHFHYVEEICCDALVELKTSFQNENSDPEVKHTFLPVLIKSLSMALSRFPLLNSCFDGELQAVTLKGSHNVGIAMATEHGLVVPNIKKVQSLSILEITKELSRLQKLASSNRLSHDDISRGTITLSNIGAIGGKFGSPLVNVPEVAIIAVGRMRKVPHFDDDGNVYPASVMSVNIGADHRVLDGATVARFCNEWKLLIEKPELLLLSMR